MNFSSSWRKTITPELENQPQTCYNLNMSVFTSLGILIISMLIIAFLQLSPGIFALLSHYASGKYSKNKASDLSIFYIFGVEIINTTIFLIVYFVLCALASSSLDFNNLTIPFCLITAILGLFIFFFYFRKGSGTRLFISRNLAKKFDEKVRTTKTRSDSFILGVISTIPELFITFPIYFILSIEIMKIGTTPLTRAFLIIIFILFSIFQHLAIHFLKHFNYNLAEIIRFRTKNKLFIRLFLSLLFILLSILIFTSKVSL